MFFGVSHLILPVTDLPRATRLWCEAMGFEAGRQGEGYQDIDTGNVAVRLMQVPTIESKVSMRVAVRDVPATYEALIAAGCTGRYEPMHTPELEAMAGVTDPDGHSLVVWRALTEDEWGFVPELPKEGEWQPDAEQLLKNLLAHVPALFRMLARRKTTRIIEMMAREAKSPVTREIVIKGYITASAKITRYRLIEPLRSQGINPDDYQEEFDYE